MLFRSSPRISLRQFCRVLTDRRSPAAPVGPALYAICVRFGIDPAVFLAFFLHESQLATDPGSVVVRYDTKNAGNLRSNYGSVVGVVIQTFTPQGMSKGPFVKYASWEDGCRAWCERIIGRYIGEWGLETVAAAVVKYAPSADGNKPAAYAAAVEAAIAAWQAADPERPSAPPSALAALGLVDLRSKLARRPERDRARVPASQRTGATIHYVGKAEDIPESRRGGAAAIVQIQSEASYHVKKLWGRDDRNNPLYGDGLMYHAVVDSLGTIYWTRDWDAHLWHCGVSTGNTGHLSIHFLLGGTQQPTPTQWQRGALLLDALIAEYHWAGRQVIKAHCEWKRTDCPGPHLLRMLKEWRPGTAPAAAGDRRYRVVSTVSAAAVRTDRSATVPKALNDTAELVAGTEVLIDDVTNGWAHLSVRNPWRDLGFIAVDLLEPV